MRRDEENVVRKVLSMNVDGYMSRGRPKKRWMDCVKNDMARKEVSDDMTKNREVPMEEEDMMRRPQMNWNKGKRMMRMMMPKKTEKNTTFNAN